MRQNEKLQNKFRFKTNINDSEMRLRLPSCIKNHIENEAKKNGRSRIAEVLIRLVNSFYEDLNSNRIERIIINE